MDRKYAEGKLLKKAAQDPQFRAALVADPRAAIEREFGVSLPQGIQIHVLEEESDKHYLILPADAPARELSKEQLDAVAAGWFPGYATGPPANPEGPDV